MNYKLILADVLSGSFCDTGHYHCPFIRQNGTIIFPSGVLRPDGSFNGATRLQDEIERRVSDRSGSGPELYGCGPCPHLVYRISDTIERIGDTLIVTGRRNVGFGSHRTDVPRRDVVRIVPTDEFEKLLTECAPTGHHDIGLNAGAPLDGLEEHRGGSGIRYLVCRIGPDLLFMYADIASVVQTTLCKNSIV